MGIFSEPPTGAGFTKISGLLETALTLAPARRPTRFVDVFDGVSS